MERLTGGGSVYHDLVETDGKTCEEICRERNCCDCCPIQDAIDKLEAYENTGLSPEEVAELAGNTKGKA